jgi:hypothetical protein
MCYGTGTNVHLNSSRPDCERCNGSGICPSCGGRGSGLYGSDPEKPLSILNP